MAFPGFLMLAICPLGGPQVNFASTSSEAFGICLSVAKSNFLTEIGPRPAGSSPISNFKLVGVRKLFPSL